MNVRQIVTLALATLAFTGAHAQGRHEPPESPFVWEALGATPSLRLPMRAQPATPARTEAPKAARPRVVEAPRDEFTVDTLTKKPVASVAPNAPTSR